MHEGVQANGGLVWAPHRPLQHTLRGRLLPPSPWLRPANPPSPWMGALPRRPPGGLIRRLRCGRCRARSVLRPEQARSARWARLLPALRLTTIRGDQGHHVGGQSMFLPTPRCGRGRRAHLHHIAAAAAAAAVSPPPLRARRRRPGAFFAPVFDHNPRQSGPFHRRTVYIFCIDCAVPAASGPAPQRPCSPPESSPPRLSQPWYGVAAPPPDCRPARTQRHVCSLRGYCRWWSEVTAAGGTGRPSEVIRAIMLEDSPCLLRGL